MANIITKLTARIADFYKTNKKPCKAYATEAAADKAGEKMADIARVYFCGEDGDDVDYVVFYFAPMGKWVACINLSEVMNRKDCKGGYIGICTGFFTY
jgi:hypothetical protein